MTRKIFLIAGIMAGGIFFLSAFSFRTEAPVSTTAIRSAAAKGLLLLQKSSYIFTSRSKAKCTSCHHNTLTSMAAGMARLKGIPVIDSLAQNRVAVMESSLQQACNPNLINQFLPINFPSSYILLGLYAEKTPPDLITDMSVDYLMSQARPDGSFLAESGRAPLETGDIHLTAFVIRAIRIYAAPARMAAVNELTARTRQWLEKAHPDQQQELAFQLLGQQWCNSTNQQKEKVAARLLAMQDPDGGWSQLPTMKSDAYATGQSLYALYESGMVKPEDPAYQKGLGYLLKTQDGDGAWIVATRAYPIQPFVNSDFPPYDENQFISAAASNWAVMALLNALPDKTD